MIAFQKMHGKKVFVELKRRKQVENLTAKKCVAYPQDDILFIKLITSFRISFLNICKKDFPVPYKNY
jgi:hypothetical protein